MPEWGEPRAAAAGEWNSQRCSQQAACPNSAGGQRKFVAPRRRELLYWLGVGRYWRRKPTECCVTNAEEHLEPDPRAAQDRLHDHRLTLFSVSSGMVGVCLTAVGLIGVLKSIQRTETMIDEILTFSALLFLIATGLYFSLMRRQKLHRHWLDHLAEGVFFVGLALLLVACALFTVQFKVSGTTSG
jgi:hypothetical protein